MIELTKEQLDDKLSYIDKYRGHGNAASLSEVDANANVDKKNIATLAVELHKDIDVQLNRYALGKRIGELFGESSTKRYYELLEDHVIYSHDESAAFTKPYCVAIDLFPFLLEGTLPLGGDSKAPKHLDSFCGSYVNLIFAISSQFAGAVADVSLLTFMDYFARKDLGDDYINTHTDLLHNKFQQIFYTLNEPAGARGYQAVFYNTSIFDRYYFEHLFGKVMYPDGTNPVWDSVDKLQKFFMKWLNNERKKALLTFPVMTAAFLVDSDSKAKDIDFKRFLAMELSEGNSFFIYNSNSPDSLSSCCRLRNDISDNAFSYTLGGTGLATGSKKVFTINFNRLIQKGYILKEVVDELHKYLVAYNTLLEDHKRDGMLPVYDAGFIHLDKQFLTIGVNGMVEAAEFMGMKIDNNRKYISWVQLQLASIKEYNRKAREYYSKQFGRTIMFNTEFVPAENLGVKFAKWDKEDGLVVKRDCYNSYLYRVEDDSIDYVDKLSLHGDKILRFLDGGSAVHLNLAEHPTAGTCELIIDKAVELGSNYITINVKATCCESCGTIDKRTLSKCPKCNSTDIAHATRIIGYLKKISAFSEARQKEESRRYYHE